MTSRVTIFILIFLVKYNCLSAQIYRTDSLEIDIRSKTNFLVKKYEDLNIDILYKCNSGIQKSYVYQYLQEFYRSTFGNYFFELYKYDSILGSYRNITLDISSISPHTPNDFDEQKDNPLLYDAAKTILRKGEQRRLTFNLLDRLLHLSSGEYTMKLYLRNGGSFGYDENRKIITKSISYVESIFMNFKVLNYIENPSKIF